MKDSLCKYKCGCSPQRKEVRSYFPPPWNIYDYPEKTEGWIEFQKCMIEDPEYYIIDDKIEVKKNTGL